MTDIKFGDVVCVEMGSFGRLYGVVRVIDSEGNVSIERLGSSSGRLTRVQPLVIERLLVSFAGLVSLR